MSISEQNTHQTLENVTADFISEIISLGGIGPSYISAVAVEGSGYTFDAKLELSNTPDIESSWIVKTDTVETGIDDDPETGQGIGYEVSSGAAYCRLVGSNVTGTIAKLIITTNKA